MFGFHLPNPKPYPYPYPFTQEMAASEVFAFFGPFNSHLPNPKPNPNPNPYPYPYPKPSIVSLCLGRLESQWNHRAVRGGLLLRVYGRRQGGGVFQEVYARGEGIKSLNLNLNLT